MVTCLGAQTLSVATLQTCEAVMLVLLKSTNLLDKWKMHRQLSFFLNHRQQWKRKQTFVLKVVPA